MADHRASQMSGASRARRATNDATSVRGKSLRSSVCFAVSQATVDSVGSPGGVQLPLLFEDLPEGCTFGRFAQFALKLGYMLTPAHLAHAKNRGVVERERRQSDGCRLETTESKEARLLEEDVQRSVQKRGSMPASAHVTSPRSFAAGAGRMADRNQSKTQNTEVRSTMRSKTEAADKRGSLQQMAQNDPAVLKVTEAVIEKDQFPFLVQTMLELRHDVPFDPALYFPKQELLRYQELFRQVTGASSARRQQAAQAAEEKRSENPKPGGRDTSKEPPSPAEEKKDTATCEDLLNLVFVKLKLDPPQSKVERIGIAARVCKARPAGQPGAPVVLRDKAADPPTASATSLWCTPEQTCPLSGFFRLLSILLDKPRVTLQPANQEDIDWYVAHGWSLVELAEQAKVREKSGAAEKRAQAEQRDRVLRLLAAGIPLRCFLEAFSAKVLLSYGVSLAELRDAGWNGTGAKEAGITVPDMLDAQFKTAIVAGKRAKGKGDGPVGVHDLATMREAGTKAHDLLALGVSVFELKLAGYSGAELARAGVSPRSVQSVRQHITDVMSQAQGEAKPSGLGVAGELVLYPHSPRLFPRGDVASDDVWKGVQKHKDRAREQLATTKELPFHSTLRIRSELSLVADAFRKAAAEKKQATKQEDAQKRGGGVGRSSVLKDTGADHKRISRKTRGQERSSRAGDSPRPAEPPQ